MTTRRIPLRIAMAGLCAAAVLAAFPASAQTGWQGYTYIPAATQAPARGVARIAEAMRAEGPDGLALRMHLGGSLPINATNITQAVSDNTVQFGDDGFFQGNVAWA